MASAAGAVPPSQQHQQSTLTLDSLPYIDLSTLTQSDLLSLSSSSHLRHDDVFPSIDRSTFNESAGSRRQTFCRPVLHHRSRVAVAGRSSKPSPPDPTSSDDPHHRENRSIIAALKLNLRNLPEFYDIDFDYAPPLPLCGYLGERKRKRGRKPKPKSNHDKCVSVEVEMGGGDRRLEIANKRGERVDLVALAALEDPFGEELRRRTEGMGSEEELLGFLRDLGGEWCSRRRRRKIVDAGVLGDVLPADWKLLLGLKRKEGRAWVYCRRYISPGGRHFVSCKEVSEYLQSYLGLHGVPNNANQDSIQQDGHESVSQTLVGSTLKDDADKQSNEHPKLNLSGPNSLAEVQIDNLFECHKCSMTFDKKDAYLQHLLSLHQKTTRRYRLGSSVGDGVIVKDGKFECQFCHKVFNDRRRCNGHLGIHVRNFVRGIEESPSQLTPQQKTESPMEDEPDARRSRMDALIEIAQNSMLESSLMPSAEPTEDFIPDEPNVASIEELPASSSENELNSNFPVARVEKGDDMTLRNLDQRPLKENNEHMILDGKMMDNEDSMNVVEVKVEPFVHATIAKSADEINGDQSESFPVKFGLTLTANETVKFFPRQSAASENQVMTPFNNPEISDVVNVVNSRYASTLEQRLDQENKSEHNDFGRRDSGQSRENVICTESLSLFPAQDLQTFDSISHKVEDGSFSVNQNDENVARCGEIRLDETEQLNLNFGAREESHSVPFMPMHVANNEGMEETTYSSSIQFEAEEVMLDMAGGNHLTTVCVWCGVEFSHRVLDSDIQSDSVGYMCITCKAKISGQIGALDGSSSMNSHLL